MITIDYSKEPRRDILCIDVKSFFASVEAVKRGMHPLTAYIVVMSKPEENGGLVLAASPRVKREYGIKTGSRRFEIPKRSPIQIVEPRMGLYLKVNGLINEVYKEFVAESDLHIYSIDESFLDVSFSHALHGTTMEIAKKIQRAIWDRFRLVVAIGIGDNPLLAKLALDTKAKDFSPYITEWRYEDVPHTVWKISPITDMWGIGNRTAKNLYRLGIESVYGLSQYNVKSLKRIHGVIGEQLFYHAHGVDHSVLSEKYIPLSNSYGKSQILDRDYTSAYEIEVVIREMADQVAARLRKYHAETGMVHLTVGFSRDILEKGFSHQTTIYPTAASKKIIDTCLYLFRTHYRNQPVRTLAIQCGKIQFKSHLQLSLFENPEKTLQQEQLELTIDRIRNKYGYTSLIHASSLTPGGTAIRRSHLISGHQGWYE